MKKKNAEWHHTLPNYTTCGSKRIDLACRGGTTSARALNVGRVDNIDKLASRTPFLLVPESLREDVRGHPFRAGIR